MDINPLILAIPLYLLLMGVELLVQRHQKNIRYRLNDAITNIGCGITDQVAGVYFKLFGIFIYTTVYQHFAIFEQPANAYSFLIVFIGADFSYYWAHRCSHRVHLFWNAHVVHHQSEDYNLSVALRQGAFQTFFTAPFYLPWALMGFAPSFFLFAAAFVTLYQFWIHTESISKLGWFETVFNTPSHHRVHHGINAKYIDRNYAGVFIVWDKLFGTFQAEQETPTYGVPVPVRSWNPLYVHWVPFKRMWDGLQQCKRWVDKLKLMLYPPGWSPDVGASHKLSAQVSPVGFRKFETQSYPALRHYVLVQFALIIGYTALFLLTSKDMTVGGKAIAVVGILYSIAVLGAVLERKKWGPRAEWARQFFLPALMFYLLPGHSWALIGAILVSLLSFRWLTRHAARLACTK